MRILVVEPPGAEKPPILPPARQDPVAGDDQGHRIPGHSLADVARGFWPGAEFLRQGSVGRCAPPSDPPGRGIDAPKEWVLLTKIEPEAGEICLLALEIAFHSGDGLGHLRRGRAG